MLMCSLVAHLTELNGDIVAALDEIDVVVVSLATYLPCRHSFFWLHCSTDDLCCGNGSNV